MFPTNVPRFLQLTERPDVARARLPATTILTRPSRNQIGRFTSRVLWVPTRPNSRKFQISSEIKTPAIHGGQRPSATLQTFSKSLLSTRRHCVAVRAQDLLPGSALRISRTGLSPVSQTSTFLAHSASC
jgi:hypothetical protein